jgi:hypothetical protein
MNEERRVRSVDVSGVKARLGARFRANGLAGRITTPVMVAGMVGSAGLALAAARGLVSQQRHGAALRFPTAANTQSLQFTGTAGDNTTEVVIRVGKLIPNASGAATLSTVPGEFQNLLTFPLPAGAPRTFNQTVSVPRSRWPNDDVAGFQVLERPSAGVLTPMRTRTTLTTSTLHDLMGVVDLPDPADFPANILTPIKAQGFPQQVAFNSLPNQVKNTFLSIRDNPPAAFSNDYYAAFGAPLELFDTFTEWWFLAGFGNNDDTKAFYRNEQDLGFGREMHCRVTERAFGIIPLKAACYVTNYFDENAAAAGANPQATVAMDFDVNRADSVRFYVYAGPNDPQCPTDKPRCRLNNVALDGGGAKAVPQLCLNCHGGTFDPATKKIFGAHFLPFDVPFLPVPTNPPKGPQTAEFKGLNQIVWGIERWNGPQPAESGDNAMVELIEGWYGGSDDSLFDPASTFNDAFVPPGWSTDPYLYRAAIAPYCRSCHVAQTQKTRLVNNVSEKYILFHTRAQLFDPQVRSQVPFRICDRTPGLQFGVMPHAQRTYQKFWTSPARAALAVELGLGKCVFVPL